MSDQQLGHLVGEWLRESSVPTTDPDEGVRHVLDQTGDMEQVGTGWLSRLMGDEVVPVPVPATDGPRPARGFTMFSAVKFVVAGVIVALFGGFLLAGVLTTQQSEVLPAAVTESPEPEVTSEVTESLDPSVRADILPGVTLDVEEVEPGMLRVTSDGVRDLTSVEAVDIMAGYDDGIWLLRKDEFLRLGNDGSHEWPDVTFADPEDHRGDHFLDVAPDGTMWVIPRWTNLRHLDPRRAPGLRSTDGEEWTVEPCPQGQQYPGCRGFTVAPDGMVWVTWRDENRRWRLGHLGPAGWQPLDGYLPTGFRRLFFTDAGDLYGMKDGWEVLFHYGDGVWEVLSTEWWLDVGRDGTIWEGGGSADGVSEFGRFTDGEWAEFTLADRGSDFGLDRQFRVAPDGSLWFSRWHGEKGRKDAVEDGRWVCDGLVRFDGQTLDHFLPGTCIPSMDMARDGSVWVLAADEMPWVIDHESDSFADWFVLADDHTFDLYVITPEAVAASE